ncbi:MAG: SpoIIIAH-like family protein [Firmicutes bacterium]|nr:SpoIIIAH-like family protein [Bacillota bacterium]
MRQIPDRSAWLRLGLFLLLVAAMTAFVTARVRIFLQSRTGPGPAAPPALPALEPVGGLSGGPAAGPAPAEGAGVPALAPPAGAAPGLAAGSLAATGPAVAQPEPAAALALVRLDRDRARAQEREMLREVLEGQGTGEAERSQAARRYLELGERMALEMTLESLLRGRGYPDAVVILGAEGGAQVILGTEGITGEQAAAVADLVSGLAQVPPEEIRIVTRGR